jgi:TPR repeat protein
LGLGRLLRKVERYDDAEKWLNLALEHLGSEHPDYTEALILLGDLYYEKDHNDPKLYEYYHKAAIRGSSRAKFSLGGLYKFGIGGVSQDENQSLYWYKSAAIDGFAPAQYSVGRYYYGKDDYEMAISWLQKAVEQDLIDAKVIYSLCLIHIDKFPEKAYNLMLEAANANDSEAQYYMGLFSEEGFSVRKNRGQAIVWYKKAAENGDEDAKAKLRELGELPLLNIRMTDVAKELKVGVSTLVDYMKKNGYNIELSPNTKLDQYMYSMLIEEFKS